MRRSMIALFFLLAIGCSINVVAQVTTSNMTGVVKNEKGEELAGATITLRHEPTGSVFTVVSRAGGRFDVNNIPPGGPYNVKVSYVGYTDFTRGDINIPLGEKFDLQATLAGAGVELQAVTISAGRRNTTVKTGASTNISNRLVQNLPNVSRSLTNLTRLTPQSNGNSFAGMNNRYNNITIDGSLFNNNFGRSGDGMIPGGATSAISIDAVDQIQVNIAPYDVRQSGFVGGGINAVTRRGTNNWYGTAYGFYKSQDFTGEKVKGDKVDNADRSTKIFGASIGGPIIKDKLFFFVNYEQEKRTQPGQTFIAKDNPSSSGPNVTAVLKSDLDNLRQYLITNYKYDPGGYQGYNFETENKKFLGRVDWNITGKHRLTLRYTQSETDDDDQINASSTASPIPRIAGNSRRGGRTGGMAYTGSNFKNNVVVKSGVLELNSNFSSKITNQLIGSYTDNQLKRVPNSTVAFVDIMRDVDNVYISFGTDLFSYLNNISDKALNIADNVTINLGQHTVTGGVSYEYMQFANSFTGGAGPSYYRYASLADFLSNSAPTYFSVAYDPNNRLGIKVPEAKFAQLGIYAQDVWSPSDKFKLTYGLRVDLPFYPYDPPRNPALEAVTFKDENGNDEKFDVSKWPKQRPLFSPRVGFTYDPEGDKSIIVRGGTGLFTGRIPFIWLVNQVGDNGVIRAQFNASAAQLTNIRYNPDRTTYIPPQNEIPPVGTTIPTGRPSYTAVDKDFKMPQVWRSNLAIDRRFAGNYVFTLEAIYTKQINNAYFRNANLGAQNGTLGGAADKRPYYNVRLNDNIGQMIVLDNTDKGYSFALTAQVQKTFSQNWEAGLAYTWTLAEEVAIGSGDQSASGFNTNNIIFNPNKPDQGPSNYAVPHRIVANLSKRFNYWGGKMATTIGMFYSAQPQERYTYRYGSDINGDGQANDVLYIPKDPSEITFVEGFKVTSGGVTKTWSANQQRDAFFAFIENDNYLRKHKGQYMEKYGALLPWSHSLDIRVLQDFSLRTGTKKHTLQFSVDIINALNLINSEWGYRYQYTFGTFQDMGILGVPSASNNTGGEVFNRNAPKFTFNPENPKAGFQPNYSTTSTWGIQLGLRYIFNN
ncbi:TonB-dependent receptor [Pseudoflavitalea sp. X16]|uniref:TonB-dependent receptor n=1 Tax=Paraflavitalea devenefica TaxID=2716334 RepID=UPI00142368B0|nr:carboxypeptidase regulatory-like domain-containing protein [Paraflavitalea devenefica]NII25768.1 TonB-dependent receptor [Paraflavitalea devenefica]